MAYLLTDWLIDLLTIWPNNGLTVDKQPPNWLTDGLAIY